MRTPTKPADRLAHRANQRCNSTKAARGSACGCAIPRARIAGTSPACGGFRSTRRGARRAADPLRRAAQRRDPERARRHRADAQPGRSRSAPSAARPSGSSRCRRLDGRLWLDLQRRDRGRLSPTASASSTPMRPTPPARRRRLQPRLQPALRVQPAHHLPAAAAAEPADGRRHRRRAEVLRTHAAIRQRLTHTPQGEMS